MEKQDLQKKLMPEYRSRNPLVRNLFWSRVHKAILLAYINNGFRILDIGCGAGQLLKEISQKYENVKLYGIDINPNYIKGIKIKNCRIKIGDVRNLNFKNRHFDIVFALDTLEHIKDIKKAISEIKRVLKDNGSLIISAPTETFFYKFGRLLTKGKYSEEDALCSPHFHNSDSLITCLKKEKFRVIKQINLPKFPVLFKILKLKQ